MLNASASAEIARRIHYRDGLYIMFHRAAWEYSEGMRSAEGCAL